ncbi:MAG: CoA transferase [Myxococcales bacterium]|nr:CoA transferase [Myxococcales bacterium]
MAASNERGSSSASRWPLAGVRVLEIGSEIAVPYATKLIADAGADVIKLEPGEAGDPLRRWTASDTELPADRDGALFQFLNASKRSVRCDPVTPTGRELILDLAASIDLVVEDLGPGVLDGCGLGFDALRARNPALSLVSLSTWGSTGPWIDRPATEWTLQASVGSTGYRGLPERGPVASGGRIGEWGAGTYVGVAAASALLSTRNTGAGQFVDVSMFETLVAFMTIQHDLSFQFNGGPLLQALETPSIEPAKDGWVGLCTYTGQQWKDFCSMIGRQDLGEDKRFYDATARMEHLALIQEAMHAWTREHSVDEIIESASLLRIPAAPIGDGRNLPEMDHLKQRGVFVDNPGGFVQPRPPYVFEKSRLRPIGAAPTFGQHTDEVKAELAIARPAITAGDGAPALPLSGIRVVDLTCFWAGPVATSYLAEMGADVIKVESIQRPDGMRFSGAVRNEIMWEWSHVFHGANSSKRDVTLQLESEAGMSLLLRLIEKADLVVENFSARVMDNFGLTWEKLSALNPRLSLVRMPAFGLDGPWRDRPGFAPNVEQVSGLAWMTGYEDLPLIVRGACDPLGGMHTVFAIFLALEHRRRTGEGQLVEVPLVEPALNLAAEQVIEYSAYGELLERAGNRGPAAAPQGAYPCADGEHLAIAVATDAQWQGLVAALGRPAWALADELASAAGRHANHDRIDDELRDWLTDQSVASAETKLLEAGVPASACVNAHFLHPNPQLEHRRFFQTFEHPVAGSLRYPGFPAQFSAFGPHLRRAPAPTLGQHNDEILREELGLSDAEIAKLRETKIVGERPTFM